MAVNDHVLTQKQLHDLLSYDPSEGIFRWKITRPGLARVGSIAGTKNREGYIQIKVNAKMHGAHRLAWFYVHGEWPLLLIDHINGVSGDNRICNLRLASPTENAENQRRAKTGNSSGFLGVSKHYKGWRAIIGTNGKHIQLGTYKTPEEAHQVYLKAKRELHTGCTI